MKPVFSVYCDESCHLEKDRLPIMALGAVWCRQDEAKALAAEIRAMKLRHKTAGELKWTKVSQARMPFYIELANWFLHKPGLNFRALVVREKWRLNHEAFNQGSHDTFYYKMYFSLLREILDPRFIYNIYLDTKDTRSRQKLRKLEEVLCNNVHDFTHEMINHIQNIHSYEFELMQLADLLLGAVSYRNRSLSGNRAKESIIATLEKGLHRELIYSTPRCEDKFNIFMFTPRGVAA